MNGRAAGTAGIAAVVVFWGALFGFAARHPGYSHQTKAISELGALGAPHALAWNLIGFVVPGLLLAICGAGLARAVAPSAQRSALYWLLLASGLAFAGTGILPAEMRDGSPLMTSPFTLGHVLMSSLSGIAWLVAAFVLIGHVRRNPAWRHRKGIAVALAVAAVAGFAASLLGPALPFLADRPGLAQRATFGVYFAWFLVLALELLTRGGRP